MLTRFADAEKRKYFKVEKTQTAGSSAAWSADAVKRRRIENKAQEEKRRRENLVKDHIKRHRLRRDVVTSGLLSRELRAGPAGLLAGGGNPAVNDLDLSAAAWARGVVSKGALPFAPSYARERHANMPCFYVNGDDSKTGLGVAYASKSTLDMLLTWEDMTMLTRCG